MSNDPRDVFRAGVMAAVDIGVWAAAMWMFLLIWLPFQNAGLFTQQAIQNGVGWYGTMISSREASAVRAFIGYLVVYHLAIWGLYLIVRRARWIAPVMSDVVSLLLATSLTLCCVPVFLAGWSMMDLHLEFLSPDWLPKFATNISGSVTGHGAQGANLVIATLLFKALAIVPASLLYASSFLGSFKAYKLRKIA